MNLDILAALRQPCTDGELFLALDKAVPAPDIRAALQDLVHQKLARADLRKRGSRELTYYQLTPKGEAELARSAGAPPAASAQGVTTALPLDFQQMLAAGEPTVAAPARAAPGSTIRSRVEFALTEAGGFLSAASLCDVLGISRKALVDNLGKMLKSTACSFTAVRNSEGEFGYRLLASPASLPTPAALAVSGLGPSPAAKAPTPAGPLPAWPAELRALASVARSQLIAGSCPEHLRASAVTLIEAAALLPRATD